MDRILTIYNCGTAFNRDQGTAAKPGTAGELIASLYDRTGADDIHDYGRLDLRSYNYKVIHDGPGSGPGKFGKWEVDAKGVRRYVEYDASKSKAKTPGLASRTDYANPEWVRKLAQTVSGNLAGAGWEENVASAMHVIDALEHKPEVVNMSGWSRGGVTCHMMAHAIGSAWPEIQVNIFAVDPVPGGVRSLHDERQLNIPGGVAHYSGVLAKHDRKLGFGAAVVKGEDAAAQKRLFYPMPGVHDTVVSGAPNLLGVRVLVDFLAGRFLAFFGTPFRSRIHLDAGGICENYAIVKKNEASYASLANRGALNKFLGLGGLAPKRKNLPGGVQAGLARELREDYFVNDHHERMFHKAFPAVYKVAFQQIPSGNPVSPADQRSLKQGLDGMKEKYRNTFALLERTGLAAFVRANKPAPVLHHTTL